jgi:hypothetical protein
MMVFVLGYLPSLSVSVKRLGKGPLELSEPKEKKSKAINVQCNISRFFSNHIK